MGSREKTRGGAYRRPEIFGIGRNCPNTGLWPFAGIISLDHNQTGKTSMKKQRNSTRYQMDDSTDTIYEYTAEREASLLLFKAYRAGSRDCQARQATELRRDSTT